QLAGPLLLRMRGDHVEARDTEGVRWWAPGTVWASSARWVVVRHALACRVLHADTGAVALEQGDIAYAVVGDEIGLLGDDASLLRVWGPGGEPVSETRVEDAWPEVLDGRIVLCEHLDAQRTRVSGALDVVLDGHVDTIAGTLRAWVASTRWPDGRMALELGGTSGRTSLALEGEAWPGLATDGESHVAWQGDTLQWIASSRSIWRAPGPVLSVWLWDGMPWLHVVGHGLVPLRREPAQPLDLLGVGSTDPVQLERIEPAAPRPRDRGLRAAIEAAGHPIEPALDDLLGRLEHDGPAREDLAARGLEATEHGLRAPVTVDRSLRVLGRRGRDLWLIGVHPPDPRHPVLR
ncbi:MAG: hypothetical protein KC656_35515, partial [Myxococcales bacterium]|nr:hypothetical protein [Myxococcales bacterium]